MKKMLIDEVQSKNFKEFSHLTNLASLLCDVPLAYITLFDENLAYPTNTPHLDGNEQSFASNLLLLCKEVIKSKSSIIIENTLKHQSFFSGVFPFAETAILFYAGFPINNAQGKGLGVLSLLGYEAKTLSKKQEQAIESLLAEIANKLTNNTVLDSYHSFVNSSPDLIATLNTELKFINANTSFHQVLGWEHNEIIGKSIDELIHANDKLSSINRLKNILLTNSSSQFVNQIKTKEGGYKTIEWFVLSSANSTLNIFGKDHSQLQQSEINVSRLTEILDITNNVARVGRWEIDIEKKTFFWSAITRELHEVDPDYEPTFKESLYFFRNGKSRKAIIRAIIKAIKYGDDFDLEVQIITQKGLKKWVRVTAKTIIEQHKCVRLYGTFQDIHEKKVKDKQISLSEERFRQTFDNAATGMFIAELATSTFIEVNEAFSSITQYDKTELLSLNIRDLIHPDDLKMSDDFFLKLLSGVSSVISFQNRYITKNNTNVWVELVATIVRDHKGKPLNVIGQVQDVTAKRTWERKLLLSEEEHRGFFENSQGLMCTHDLEGSFLTVNPAGAALLGYTTDEFLTKSLFDITPERTRDKIQRYLESIAVNHSYKGLVKVVHKNGSFRTWLSNNVLAELLDGRKYVIGNSVDMTERIKMERELISAKVSAERNAHAKDVFLANMSHEIRTPMNAITGFANLLKETKLDSEQKEFVSNINTAAENLLGIINDILDLSKIESGHLVIESVPFNLHELVKNVKAVLTYKALGKGLELDCFVPDNIPVTVIGDPTRLNQIFLNLTNNAIKFTEKGSVKIVLELQSETDEEYSILFKIMDTGIGISQDKQTIIFDRFAQANSDTTRKYGGTGLGLSISKLLIEKQKGNIFVESQPNEGSTFYFNLTFRKVNDKVVFEQETHLLPIDPTHKVKILLAEDNVLNQKLALKVLERFGFFPDLAENGKIAVMKVQKHEYDVILMDLQMPEMDGYQATSYIRNTLKNNTPIIALTAHSLIGEKEKCLAIGMNDYITKPFSPKDLFNKIVGFINVKVHENINKVLG
ncbi:PAS domain S-box protein [Arcicella aquatica]|uniref:histidine kinase n=1 Tax=Arcicella aquatica TaxID=217141 RepID=A0ABU5QUK3_9BACT|nr:PAS domain S-box protein [Arcicella aquatica]MEA5260031.1 PAS domain S-box protein [Arcicella aquatica]